MSVRVRFAPSPTGWLHVGGARTAYFNWLFARQRGGAFVVRIEDTDVERSSADSERGVLADLEWLGLAPDEGPAQGGPYGPYRQSERTALYRERAGQLVACGAQYDGTCRRLSAAERDAARASGRPESIRFVVEDRDWVFDDLVREEVRFPAGQVGDFVILRANGLPTYNFACAVDDDGMKISHVIRAEEHLPNTARQLMIYAALGAEPPRFAHLALILNRDRTKMSKRSGEAAVAVGDWRRAGYVPDALLSYLALLGFHPGDDREILSRAELLEAFTFDRVGKSGSVFDAAKLAWTNATVLHHADGATLAGWSAEFLPESARALPREELEKLLETERGNIATLADLPNELRWYLEDAPPLEAEAAAALEAPRAKELLGALASELAPLAPWSGEAFKSALQSTGKRLGLKGRDLFQPVRAALTGRTHGPELPLLAELLGRERCLARIERAASA